MKNSSVKYAKLFPNGSSQAVRLPREFRFEGDKVRIRRVGSGVLLEPVQFDVKAWFARMDRHGPTKLERPRQPPILEREPLV